MPPPLLDQYREIECLRQTAKLPTWLRLLLSGLAFGLIVVFAVALWLNPYHDDGSARLMETHTQLGAPECSFKWWTGRPCPSCGMTTSFALLIRGDVVNSLRANSVGTLLAGFCLLLIPYGLVTSIRGRYWLMPALEWLLPRAILVFCALLFVRWGLVLWLAG